MVVLPLLLCCGRVLGLSCFVVVLLLLHVSLFYCGGFVWVIGIHVLQCRVAMLYVGCIFISSCIYDGGVIFVFGFNDSDLLSFLRYFMLLCIILIFWDFVYNGLFLLSNFFVI